MLAITYKNPETPEAIAHNETVTAARKQYKKSLETLIAAHKDSNSPKATVEATIAAIGYEMTEAIIATITNAKAWDGRISDANKEWAAKVDECLTKETADRFRLYSDAIHPVHIDQIADAMRKAERPAEAPQNAPESTEAPEAEETTTEAAEAETKPEEAITNYFIINKGTNKIELHFDKAVYMALDEETKKAVKSACLFSRGGGCWVSRGYVGSWSAINAKKLAEKIGLENAGADGERLSFAEQMERKAERAEARAERYEARADRAAANGEALQAPIESMRGDTAFFTQPNINSSAGRAFTNRRNRMFAAWEKGFEEFQRSDYWNERAETARRTAKGCQKQSIGFCQRRIDECNAGIKKLVKNIESYKKHLEKLEAGETIKLYGGELLTVDKVNEWIESTLDRIEAYTDKASYYQAMIEDQGGLKFNKENVNLGDIVTIERWGQLEVVRKGIKNLVGKFVDRPSGTLQFAYSEIRSLDQKAPEERTVNHGFEAGTVYTVKKWSYEAHDYIPCTVELVKVTNDKATVKVDGGRAKSVAIRNGYSGGYYIPVNTSEPGSVEHYEWIHPKTQNA